NPWRGFHFLVLGRSGEPPALADPHMSAFDVGKSRSWYPHTATNEPHGPLARLRCDNAARGSRGNDADLEVLLGGRGGAHARPYRAQCPPFATAPAPVMHSPTTASLPTITPNVPAADTNVAAEPSQPPPAKSASSARRSHHSARVQRRSH